MDKLEKIELAEAIHNCFSLIAIFFGTALLVVFSIIAFCFLVNNYPLVLFSIFVGIVLSIWGWAYSVIRKVRNDSK